MLLAKELGVSQLLAKTDSKLITGQVSEEYQARDPQLACYLKFVHHLSSFFSSFKLIHVPREQNSRTDLLAKLASNSRPEHHKSVIRETLITPRVNSSEPAVDATTHINSTEVASSEASSSWTMPYITYLANEQLPQNPEEASIIKKNAARYTLIDGRLFRFAFSRPLLACVDKKDYTRIMSDLHEGICGSHIGGRALSTKIIRAGYFWPTLQRDCLEHTRKCNQCQIHSDWHHTAPEQLHLISSPWSFHTWGIDVLGPFPVAQRQVKFLIVAIEYFNKRIEVEAVAQISALRIKKFVWQNIICRFGVPRRLVSDNGTQFNSTLFWEVCREWGIQQSFSSVEHPQTNGQAEAANKIILRVIRRKVCSSRSNWPKLLPGILLSYHTTPQTTTRESPFCLVYGADAMLPIEISQPS